MPRSLPYSVGTPTSNHGSLAQAGTITSIGAVPVIVLSRGQDQEQDWQEMQIDLLHLSSNSQHLIADTSGHNNIQLDQPAAAVEAIVKMVEQVRRQAVQ